LVDIRYPVSTDGRLLNTVAFAQEASAEKRESWVQKAPKAEVRQVYKGWDPTVQKLIDLMPDEIGSWALYDRLPYSSWVFEEGKVVLIGDAAHVLPTSPRANVSQCCPITGKGHRRQLKMHTPLRNVWKHTAITGASRWRALCVFSNPSDYPALRETKFQRGKRDISFSNWEI
jgi:hypothetical protein